MKTFNFVIREELGIHARPAGMLAKEAQRFKSAIKLKKGEKECVVTQLFKLMGLGIKMGNEVVVTIEGDDEDEAFEAMKNFFNHNL